MIQEDLYPLSFHVGSELQTSSFATTQNDTTYLLAGERYQQFYHNYIRPRIGMYRGWINGFHNIEYGQIPTLFLQKIGATIVSTLFGRPIILNSQDDQSNNIIQKQYKTSNYNNAVKEVYNFAIEGGTGLIKWNKDGKGQLRADALPMDKFFVTVNAYGEIQAVKCFVATYHNTINANVEYYLCEERFFKYVDDTRYPMVHYLFYKTSNDIINETTEQPKIVYGELPNNIQNMIRHEYGDVVFDTQTYDNLDVWENCQMLPFDDDLGCRLIKFTHNIPSFPNLPFGQPLGDFLMNESYQYDQLKYMEKIEVYLARGRVMIPKQVINPDDPHSKASALDSMTYIYYDSPAGESDTQQPQIIQFPLRADDINRQKANILNDVALSLGLSSTTIASWLSDGQTQKTATEIEYERGKTTTFICDKLDIIQQPLQEMIDIYFHYYGAPSPMVTIVPESQTIQSDRIQLYSTEYDKGHIPAKILAKAILDTGTAQEVDELAQYIENNKQQKGTYET